MASANPTTTLLTLPSNSSMHLYPGNTLADYRVQLPKTLNFDTPHEVALTGFHYPKTWFNFPKTEHYSVTYREFNCDLQPRMNWDEDRDGGEVRIDRESITEEDMIERVMAGGYSEGSSMDMAFLHGLTWSYMVLF